MTGKILRSVSVVGLVCCMTGTPCPTIEPETISVTISNTSKGSLVWAGVVVDGEDPKFNQLLCTDSPTFLLEVPKTLSDLTLVLFTKNAVPILKSLTPELIKNGVSVELSNGTSILGSVRTKKEANPVSEGVVTIQFDNRIGVPFIESGPEFTWDLAEDGSFEITGIPEGEHIVTVAAPGYMPVEQLVDVENLSSKPELHFRLVRATYISGRIIDLLPTRQFRPSAAYSDKSIEVHPAVKGELDIVFKSLSPQTTKIRTIFDTDNNFRVGPFAEESEVELVARLFDGQRSRRVELITPAENVDLYVHDWVGVTGRVLDRVTGQPVEKYTITTSFGHHHRFEVDDPDGQFFVEVGQYARDLSIVAPGYLFWTSTRLNEKFKDKKQFDFDTIELNRAYEVQGQVSDQTTDNPIENAEIRRVDGGASDPDTEWRKSWNYGNVKTTTDAEGKFKLLGIPEEGGEIYVSANGFEGVFHEINNVVVPIELNLTPLGSISGQVVSIDGTPIAAMINFPDGGERTEDGTFHFHVGAGTHHFWAVAELGRSQVVEIQTSDGEIVDGVRIVIDIIGRVFGMIEGLLDNETAKVWTTGSIEYGLTNGFYELTGIPSGDHVVQIKTSLGRQLEGSIVLDTSLEAQFDFQFTGNYSLVGTVFAAGQPLSGYRVHAIPKNAAAPTIETRTNESGSYSIEGLAEGIYGIEIPGRALNQEIEIHGDTLLDISVGENILSGKLMSTNSVRDAVVRLKGGPEDRELSRSIRATVDANGEYRFYGLPTGTYTIEVTHPDYVKSSSTVEVYYEDVTFDVYLDELKDTE